MNFDKNKIFNMKLAVKPLILNQFAWGKGLRKGKCLKNNLVKRNLKYLEPVGLQAHLGRLQEQLPSYHLQLHGKDIKQIVFNEKVAVWHAI